MSTLANQTVVIVGASSGIGLAAGRACASQGARVVLSSRSQAKLEEAAKSVQDARALPMDMLDRGAVDRVIGGLDTIDHLVLTAVADELSQRAHISALTKDQVERSFDKLRGFVNVVRAAVPKLRERGTITLLSGASAVWPPRDGFSVLAAAGGSIVSFGRALALELAPIRVNVVMPGVVDTPIHTGRRDEVKAWAESADLPARYFGQPEDIAHAIVFVMTNPYMTGHTLNVDGGFVVR
jgi:NAD(P)-dependent dehydrogenase (short-subunit alcohol dehydrogenase family)